MNVKIPEFARRFYALHICEGITSKNGPNGDKTILVREETLTKMDPSFQGKPVKFSLDHLTLGEYDQIAESENKGEHVEGVVNKSFFNEADGRHWAEILVWDEKALAAIERGIGVSNAYVVNSKAPGGEYHATDYDEEIMDGEYDHLLITAIPRYEESRILTPEEFKQYNESRKQKLAMVTNQKKGETTMAFKIFERKSIEDKITDKDVTLPKSGKTVSIERVLNTMDEQMVKEAAGEQYADMDHKVKLHDNTVCNVGELVEKHKALMEENTKLKGGEGTGTEEVIEELGNETPEEKELREKDEKDAKDKAEKDKMENQKKAREAAARVKNAKPTNTNVNGQIVQEEVRFKDDAVAAGKDHYGQKD